MGLNEPQILHRRNNMHVAVNVAPPAETLGTLPSLLEQLEQEGGEQAQSAEAVVSQFKADLLADLEAKAFQWIARGREAKIELGRVFNQIKNLLEHGNWEPYYETTFAPKSVALRTAQLYMKLACEADELKENANFALFPPATDPQATAVNAAVAQAEQAVANATAKETGPREAASTPTKTREPHKSRIRLDALRESQNWRGAELAIRATIDRLLVQYGYVNDPAGPEFQDSPQPRKRLEIIPDEIDLEPYPGADEDVTRTEVVPEEEPEYENALA
jgi:hypothetical protein